MEEVARIVLALEIPDVAEEVMHFLDRSGRARVVGTATDGSQLADAVRQLEPDAVVATPSLVASPDVLNGSAYLAVDTAQSIGTLRRALRVGASGFYLWPAERDELAHAAARARTALEHAGAESAPVVAVFGPRGGAGATFVATHLAAAYARRDQRCLLIDLDIAFADVTAALGVPSDEPVRSIDELVALGDEVGPRHVEEVAWHHPAGFGVLLAPTDRFVRVRGEDCRRAIAAARRTCDVVVLHVPRALDEVALTGLEVADRVLLVLALDVLSFRDARRAIEVAGLEERCAFVVNGASRSEVSPKDVARVFGQPPIAVIPRDRAVRSAQDRGRLLPGRGRVGRAVGRLARVAVEGAA